MFYQGTFALSCDMHGYAPVFKVLTITEGET